MFVGEIQVDHHSESIDSKMSKPCEFKQWLTRVCRTIKPSEGTTAFFETLTVVSSLAKELLIHKPQVTQSIGLAFTHTASTLSLANLIGDLQWWACEEAGSKQEKTSMFFFTTWR